MEALSSLKNDVKQNGFIKKLQSKMVYEKRKGKKMVLIKQKIP